MIVSLTYNRSDFIMEHKVEQLEKASLKKSKMTIEGTFSYGSKSTGILNSHLNEFNRIV